jgi:hypothetical protein
MSADIFLKIQPMEEYYETLCLKIFVVFKKKDYFKICYKTFKRNPGSLLSHERFDRLE